MMNLKQTFKGSNTVMKFLASLLFALSMASAMNTVTSPTALATDLDPSAQASAESGNRFVRLAINKSAVIKLPAEAADVIVGDSEIVDAVLRRKDTVYLFARRVGQTNVFFFDAEGNQILALDFEVAQDALPLRKILQRHLPGNRITVDTMSNSIVLAGEAKDPQEALQAVQIAEKFLTAGLFSNGSVVNMMKIRGDNQVMLKVKVVEIQRDVFKQLGVDLQAALTAGEFVFNLASINPFANSVLSTAAGAAATDNVGNQRFQSVIRAMERDGLVRTLAEPNLTAVSGQAASFLAGGEFGYRVRQSGDNDDITVAFKQFGVSLSFTPTVLTNDRISLKIRTEVSEIGELTDGIPALNTRSADTTLESSSGSSMMIAGLIRETTRQHITGTPGLRKLPVLGALFRSREFINNQTELVVIVTPYLVKPTAAKNLITPDKNFHPASEKQAVFMGKMHKNYNASGKLPPEEYNGSVGFIVE